ncbi:MAG TPA: TetR/AcrR family transcriptional regulator [Deltaproteobacteria bacterium]|nr:TetR/AcrR family transcriptional regulator [Deltaproteobacteria bacterium]
MPSLIERKRQYTRDMIVGAAEDLFSRHGYHNTQVMDIVKTVGMSAGTFYNYFKDKRDLFAQIAHQNLYELRRRIKKLREPVNIWDHGDRVEKLNASYGAYFDYISSHRQQFLMILRGSFGVDEEMDITIWKHYSDIAQDLADDIQSWLDIGIIEGVNPLTMAYAVVGMAMHLGHSYLMEKKFTREEAIATLTTMSHLMFESHMTEAGREALDELK